jgi:hypothetical protein
MTRPDLDAIEARANAATPGPWRSEPGFCGSQQRKFLRRESGMDRVLFGRHCVKAEEAQYDLDCDFTASARTDVPALADYVRELETQLKADSKIARLAREYVAAHLAYVKGPKNGMGLTNAANRKAELITAVSAEGEK